MNKFWLSLSATLFLNSVADAQVRQFPYEARVVVEEAYVRSGGGDSFYPTATVPRETKVTVRRHDPGGWYMIDPPEGSFSWVPAKYVREIGAGKGEIIESDIVVFVGSEFGDETNVWQRKMMAGESVSILGRRNVDTLSGPQPMYKISPPTREFRWIPGTSVVPVGEEARVQHDRNPYVIPSDVAEQMAQAPVQAPTATAQAAPQNTSRFSPSQKLVHLQQIREEQRQLQQIDQQFRSMILSDPSKWDLDAIEQKYLELQGKATFKPVAGQIDLRYPAISRYRQRKAELDEFNRLTSATEKRDADLMASQFGVPSLSASATSFDSMSIGSMSIDQPFPVAEFGQGIPSTGIRNFGMAGTPVTGSGSNTPSLESYVGAGYIQEGAPGTDSPFLLTAPDGKLLAHVKPKDGVSLEEFVGRSVGLIGTRKYDDTINSDRIEVTGLNEVRIKN